MAFKGLTESLGFNIVRNTVYKYMYVYWTLNHNQSQSP